MSRRTTQPQVPGLVRGTLTPGVMVRFVAATAGTVVVSLVVFVALMRPSPHDLALMTVLLSSSALASVLIGYLVYRLQLLRRSPRIAWTLLGGYALVGVLTFFNVWLTARLMFLSAHDLVLAAVLLLFGAGIAVSVGYLLSSSFSDDAGQLARAAEQVALGRLDVRLEPTGRDEMADIGMAFNDMADALARSAEQQRTVDGLRRDLIAWVGHDLHTPLTSIRVILEALMDGVVEDPDTIQRYLRTAHKDVSVLSLLIDDLSVLAQIDAGGLPLDRQPDSLGDLVSDTLESFSLRAERQGVSLRGEMVGSIPVVSFDARHIGRVLANLIDNALRHTALGRRDLRQCPAGRARGVGPGARRRFGHRSRRHALRVRPLLPSREVAQPGHRGSRARTRHRARHRRGSRGNDHRRERCGRRHQLHLRTACVLERQGHISTRRHGTSTSPIARSPLT